MDNTQLPAEVEIEIAAKAEAIFERMKEHSESEWEVKYAEGFAEGWADCATEYATKLHHAEKDRQYAYEEMTKARSYFNDARALLEKAASVIEPMSKKLYNEIKTFLDGK